MPLLARWQDNDDGDDNDVDDNDGRGADPVPRVVRNVLVGVGPALCRPHFCRIGEGLFHVFEVDLGHYGR